METLASGPLICINVTSVKIRQNIQTIRGLITRLIMRTLTTNMKYEIAVFNLGMVRVVSHSRSRMEVSMPATAVYIVYTK